MRWCYRTLLAAIVFSPVFLVQAQTCGNIITPSDFYYEGQEEESYSIADCANPFGRTGDLDTLKLGNQTVANNGVYNIEALGTSNYGFAGETYNNSIQADYYLHSGSDFVRIDTQFEQPTEASYEAEVTNFFNGNQIQTIYYINALRSSDKLSYYLISDNPRVYRLDPVDPTKRVVDVYVALEQYIVKNAKSARKQLLPGTYTVVQIDTDEGPNPTYNPSLLERFFATLIPTAHAYYNVNTVTFTLVGPAPEPQGASSVLFLPGIQASRLYSGEDGPGGNAFERIWEPGNNNDVEALAMTVNGKSIKKTYTSDILKTITTDFIFGYQYESGSVYQGFSDFMDTLATDEVIREWYPFAYDWRYDVFDIVQNGTIINQAGTRQFLSEIARGLAQRSKTGKVTIIAHSNGGLLAKALMIELQKTGDESLVDQIIFLGTPQLGTPKALGTILHGYDQAAGSGLIVKDTTARATLNNFPGAYALLPSATYISQTDTPVVSFDNSASTQNYRTLYGTAVTNEQVYQNFLNGTASENRSFANKIYQPVAANAGLLANALASHTDQLDSWAAPSSTKVVSIIGTGIPTMKALKYEDVLENICPPDTIFSTLSLCAIERLPRPFAIMTYFGDKTVTGLSAKGYVGTGDKYFVDLKKITNVSTDVSFNHENLTETNYVQTLLKNLISTTTIPAIPYIINQEPIVIEPYIIQQIASPVYMHSTDSNGRVSGYIKENGTWVLKVDIPGSQYFEFAGVKYLLIPSDVDFKTTLAGQEFGGYTYKISELKLDDTQIQLSQLVNATTTPTMVATVEKKAGQFSTIKTDFDGDAIVDYESTVNGVKIIHIPLSSYKKLIDTINNLSIKKSQKDTLLFLAREAEKLDIKSVNSSLAAKLERVTLKVLETSVLLLQKTKIITPTQAEELIKIIKFLNQ